MFERIKLVTRDGRFVVKVTIPKFTPPADVILWSERWFCAPEVKRGFLTYREGMMWPALAGPEPPISEDDDADRH